MCNTDREVLSACRAARAAPYRAGRRPTPQRTRPTPQRARSVPRRARGGAAARRPGAPSAPLRRPSPQPGAYLCAAPRGRGARAEHLTVSIAHGSLTRRPFLERVGCRAHGSRVSLQLRFVSLKSAATMPLPLPYACACKTLCPRCYAHAAAHPDAHAMIRLISARSLSPS